MTTRAQMYLDLFTPFSVKPHTGILGMKSARATCPVVQLPHVPIGSDTLEYTVPLCIPETVTDYHSGIVIHPAPYG